MTLGDRAFALLRVGLAASAVSVAVCGCGGGGAGLGHPTGTLASSGQTASRSLQLNNYNNWAAPGPSTGDYEEKVQMLARRNRICMTEVFSYNSELTPAQLRRMNPQAKVYRVYDLICKSNWDSDWRNGGSHGDLFLCTPILLAEIVKNDWWLRDGNGEIVKENDSTWFLDVGKPGFKEMMLRNMLARMDGKGFDGVVLDYHGLDGGFFDKWIIAPGLPAPPEYASQSEWANKALKPMLEYVIDGLRSRGYEIVVNCAGPCYTSSSDLRWLRSRINGTIYELWALESGGDWQMPHIVENLINSLLDDPLEVWTADFGLRGPGCVEYDPDPEYERKLMVSLAMYYVGLPQSPALRARRSFGQYKNMLVHWEPLYDLDIGEPLGLPEKTAGKYCWSRPYTSGLVLLNYEESSPVTFPLDRAYRTPSGEVLTGEVTLEAHSALILTRDGAP